MKNKQRLHKSVTMVIAGACFIFSLIQIIDYYCKLGCSYMALPFPFLEHFFVVGFGVLLVVIPEYFEECEQHD